MQALDEGTLMNREGKVGLIVHAPQGTQALNESDTIMRKAD